MARVTKPHENSGMSSGAIQSRASGTRSHTDTWMRRTFRWEACLCDAPTHGVQTQSAPSDAALDHDAAGVSAPPGVSKLRPRLRVKLASSRDSRTAGGRRTRRWPCCCGCEEGNSSVCSAITVAMWCKSRLASPRMSTPRDSVKSFWHNNTHEGEITSSQTTRPIRYCYTAHLCQHA